MGDAGIVLCYHAVSPTWEADLSVSPDRLRAQIELLLARGYRATTFSALVDDAPAARRLAITFDDAYRSISTLAAPVLAQLGVPATVFVPTDFIEQQRPLSWDGVDQWLSGPHAHELEPMSWDELGALRDSGWEIGSHTTSHPRLSRCDDDALAHELSTSRQVCESRLGGRCASIAYPYGDMDDRVRRATAAAGYSAAAALPGRFASRQRFAWPRTGVYHGDDDRRYRLKVSRGMRLLQSTPLWAGYARSRGEIVD